METQWTSKYAILRDLSYAQGRKVPAAIVGSVGVGQKPPAVKIKEETEEEFFQNCVGDGELYTKPDLSLIKKMLNMIQESDSTDDNDSEKVIEISKLNPLSEDFVPKVTEGSGENKVTSNTVPNEQGDINIDIKTESNHVNTKWGVKPSKKRRERNVALLSLLEKEQSALGNTSPRYENMWSPVKEASENKSEVNNNRQSLEVKLLKPNDFTIDANITEAVEKVNEWLQKPVEPLPDKRDSISISPKNMFKKKTPAPLSLENTCMFKRKSDTSSVKSSDSDTVPRKSDNVFVPSTHANEYYKKFVERRQVQEMAQEDIWKRAERLMKEIDAKRLKEKEQKVPESCNGATELNVEFGDDDIHAKTGSRPTLPLNIPGLDLPTVTVRLSILLPQHRHDLPEECKVCLALAKYKQKHASTQ